MNTVTEIAALLRGLRSVQIFTHMRADGDTIGSALALSFAFDRLGIANEVLNEGELPAHFAVFPGVARIRREPSGDAAAFVCADCSEETRLGELTSWFRRGTAKGKLTVNIDHHISNTLYCRYNFVQARSSNCENMAEIIAAMGVPLDREIASCLLGGVVTDSGTFTHSDVTGDTFRLAACLVDAGANVDELSYQLMRRQSPARAQLYAKAISQLRFFLDGKLAVAYVSQQMLSDYGLKQDATSGIVDFALTIDGVEVSACIMEYKRGQYKASLRSKGKVNVNAVAGTFGGGGHILASGCMLFGETEEVFDRLRYAVYQNLEDV